MLSNDPPLDRSDHRLQRLKPRFGASGAIERVQLYHRPYDQVISFSAELSRRLRGKIDPLIFPGP
jgi:hypothetical protein